MFSCWAQQHCRRRHYALLQSWCNNTNCLKLSGTWLSNMTIVKLSSIERQSSTSIPAAAFDGFACSLCRKYYCSPISDLLSSPCIDIVPTHVWLADPSMHVAACILAPTHQSLHLPCGKCHYAVAGCSCLDCCVGRLFLCSQSQIPAPSRLT